MEALENLALERHNAFSEVETLENLGSSALNRSIGSESEVQAPDNFALERDYVRVLAHGHVPVDNGVHVRSHAWCGWNIM